jgi:peroxiredoxin
VRGGPFTYYSAFKRHVHEGVDCLGDWEWILAFEADELSDLVDCMRRLRDAEARRYTKDDTPFITGIRGEAKDVFSLLW